MDEVIEQTSLGLTTAGQHLQHHQQLSNLPARPSSQSHGDAKLRAALLSSWIRRSAESNLHHTSADLLGPGLSPRQAPIKMRCFLLACTAQGVLARPRLAASPGPRPGPRKTDRVQQIYFQPFQLILSHRILFNHKKKIQKTLCCIPSERAPVIVRHASHGRLNRPVAPPQSMYVRS